MKLVFYIFSFICFNPVYFFKKRTEYYTVTRKLLPLFGGNLFDMVIAHYNPKGFSCVRGSPLTPLRMTKVLLFFDKLHPIYGTDFYPHRAVQHRQLRTA